MSNETGRDGVTRRSVIAGGAIAAAGAGTVLGVIPLSSDEASASLSDITVGDVSVTGEEGRLASLTVAPDVTTEWSALSRSVETLDIEIAATVPGGASGDVTTHTTSDVSGTSGSYSHRFDQHDLLTVLDADTFHDDTADDEPREVGVDLAVGLAFYDAAGDQFGPAPVDLLSFTVSVTNTAAQDDPCRAEPEACEGVSLSGTMNTDASAANPTD